MIFLVGKPIEEFVGGLKPESLILSAIVEDLPGRCDFLVHEFKPEATNHYENDYVEKDISVNGISLLRSL